MKDEEVFVGKKDEWREGKVVELQQGRSDSLMCWGVRDGIVSKQMESTTQLC